MQKLLILLFVLCLAACVTKQNENISKPTKDDVRYAKGFSLRTQGTYQELITHQPVDGAPYGKVFWLGKSKHGLTIPDSVTFIEVPIKKIICTSTTHLPHLVSLQMPETLVGFPTTEYISSEEIRNLVAQGKVAELGSEQNMNLEKILTLQPNLVMGYTLTHATGSYKSLKQVGIPILYNADFLEQHPLGRAEWIRVAGALLNKYKQADSIFSAIEKNYTQLKKLADSVKHKPTVFSGVLYGDGWFMPGGKNYASVLFRDSGMRYIWEDDSSSGYLQLPAELVLRKAKSATFWIGTASFTSMRALEQADHRYTLFDAFGTSNVFHYNARVSPGGGSFYLEEGYLRPDFILADLIKIAHPELLPNHNFIYYAKLDKNNTSTECK